MTTTEIENYYYKAEMPKIRKQLAEFKEEIRDMGKSGPMEVSSRATDRH